jgi:lactoylglutathione lyase
MKLKKLIPTLMVQDVQNSIEFYKTFLNFKLVKTIPDTEPFDWAKMKCGTIEIALQSQANMAFDIPEMQGLKTGSTIEFYVEVDDIDALYAQVKDKVEITQNTSLFFPDICEFRIRDCNGYFWTFEGKTG